MYFNPLPRKEGDWMFYELRIPFVISIHSLVKRETIGGCSVRPIVYHFNPLPRKEGD